MLLIFSFLKWEHLINKIAKRFYLFNLNKTIIICEFRLPYRKIFG